MQLEENENKIAFTYGELCGRVQSGDSQAFWELAERYMAFIRGKASRYRSGLLDEEDLSQEGLLGLLAAARFYRADGKAEFRTYADVCIRNRMITALRRAERGGSAAASHLSLNREEELLHIPAGDDADPQAHLADSESYEDLIRRIVEILSPMERETLFLHLKGCSYAEMAKALQTTEKAVDNALQRARSKLKRLYPR